MKILVTGAKGQLGMDMVPILKKQHQVFAFGRNELDITNYAQVQNLISRIYPDVIIHAAAFTQVDQAELDPDTAYLVNAYGTRNVTMAAKRVRAKLIYISTDYVFDGESRQPYREFDITNPLNIYGKSKWAGEEVVRSFSDRYFIVRTSWLFGNHGKNFVKTMIHLAQIKPELTVVHDQIGSPTYTLDLAQFLLQLVHTDKYGIYHASNSGTCSWYEFTEGIVHELNLHTKVRPIATKDYPLPAVRPSYSVLEPMSIRLNGFPSFRHWKEALKAFLQDHQIET